MKSLEQLELFTGSSFEIVYEGLINKFAHYFALLDIQGIGSCLGDYNYYDGVSKGYYLKLIEKEFNNLKSRDIASLEAKPGTCNGCIKGCEGFTFIHEKSGLYVDVIIEVKNKKIVNFMECHDLNNDCELNKKERIVIKEYKVKGPI